MKLAIAQINPTVGALEDNKKKIVSFINLAQEARADLVVFPELAVTGYPPEDLLLKKGFVADDLKLLRELAPYSKKIDIIVGFVDTKDGENYNAAALLRRGGIEGVYRKMCLPNYGVFDEKRYFKPGSEPFVFTSGDGIKIALTICEDIWDLKGPALRSIAAQKPNVVINISASPYHFEKERMREEILKGVVSACGAAVVYCNMVGGQDELVFDGASMVLDEKGVFRYRSRRFEEGMGVNSLSSKGGRIFVRSLGKSEKQLDHTEEIYKSLVLGTRDYIRKNGFFKAVLGLSGGVDSSLVAKIACDAIGKENVKAVAMPSVYSSQGTKRDALAVAKNLGIKLINIPIDPILSSCLSALSKEFKGTKRDIAEENLQARIRGNMLMALSNKFGWLVLTTGNKSEISMGYCTLYGDMAGGFAVIKDVPKTLVYKLVDFVNKKEGRKIIPASVIKRPPTAELRPNQRDEDTLPPYKVLDPILKLYIEEDRSSEEIAKLGFDKRLVRDIINTVDRNEYKRRQAPPGVKITPKAFGRDRRLPIVNKYRS